MVKLSKLYTKKGDDGSTGLIGGKRVSKDHPRVVAYGDIDELNASIGEARTSSLTEGNKDLANRLEQIQNELFDIGSELATPAGESWEGMIQASKKQTERLENWTDEITESLPELRSFALPGGTPLNAQLHRARTICRRAERAIISLGEEEQVSKHVITYVNRLSDYLFAAARLVLSIAKVEETLWEPGKFNPAD